MTRPAPPEGVHNIQPVGLVRKGDLSVVAPDWPAPESITAYTTTRQSGLSEGGYSALNVADHVGDCPSAVAQNRARICSGLAMPSHPHWLNQIHGCQAVYLADGTVPTQIPTADASWTDRPGVVAVVATADCLPLLLCDAEGRWVAAVHAGWRGLAAGIVQQTLNVIAPDRPNTLAWMGPAISAHAFEVGPEVRSAFICRDAAHAACFRLGEGDRWWADLYALTRLELANAGVRSVFGGHWCTYLQRDWFYSYRRDRVCGRMASFIWLDGR